MEGVTYDKSCVDRVFTVDREGDFPRGHEPFPSLPRS